MNAAAYERVLHGAHGLRGLAQEIARDGELDAAIDACVRADSFGAVLNPTLYRDRHVAMAQDAETLRAVRVLAQLGKDLTGEGIASEPGTGPRGRSDGSARGVHALSLVKPTSFGDAS